MKPAAGYEAHQGAEEPWFDPTMLIPLGEVGKGVSLLFRGLIQLAAKDAAEVALTQFATKAAAREFVVGMGLPEVQAAAVNWATGRATTTSTITVVEGEGGSVVVNISRLGRDGYQVVESTVGTDGSKAVIQKAHDASGRMVHYDPKTR